MLTTLVVYSHVHPLASRSHTKGDQTHRMSSLPNRNTLLAIHAASRMLSESNWRNMFLFGTPNKIRTCDSWVKVSCVTATLSGNRVLIFKEQLLVVTNEGIDYTSRLIACQHLILITLKTWGDKTKNPEDFSIGVLGNKVIVLHFTFQNPHYHSQSHNQNLLQMNLIFILILYWIKHYKYRIWSYKMKKISSS